MKFNQALAAFSVLTLTAFASTAFADANSAQKAQAQTQVKTSLPVAVNAAAANVAVQVAVANPEAATKGVDDGMSDSCIAGDDPACESVYQIVMANLSRLLTPDFRVSNKIFLLEPNALSYDKKTALKLARILTPAGQ